MAGPKRTETEEDGNKRIDGVSKMFSDISSLKQINRYN